MTRRRPCPAAPGPLEGYAARFDDLFGSLAQRRGFREYLAGLLAPRDRNKTLTALAGAEPVAGAQHRSVQRLQFFLSESRWDAEQVNARRLELLLADPATAPHGGGVLVIDDSGDRKDGTKTAHVGHQWLGRYGKTDNGAGPRPPPWAGGRPYYPVHPGPHPPAPPLPQGQRAPAARALRGGAHGHGVRPRRDAGRGGRGGPPARGGAPAGPRHPAGQGPLVPGHQPAPPRRAAPGQQPAPASRSGRDRADLRHPALDRAELQAGQGPAGLGRLPGPLPHPDPPAPRPSQPRARLL